jgi:hypothetical protein
MVRRDETLAAGCNHANVPVRAQSVKDAARRRSGVIWPACLFGFLAGAAAGFLAAPDVIAVPGVLALAGLAVGLLVGMVIAWSGASERAVELPLEVGRRVADESVGSLVAPLGDGAPGWYADPRDSGARRYWDGECWTEHLWRDREAPGRERSGSAGASADDLTP